MPEAIVRKRFRITLPKEIRNALNIKTGDRVDTTVSGRLIYLRKI